MDKINNCKPLDSFPVIRSQNIEEIRQAFVRTYEARRLDLPRGVDGTELRFNNWQSQSTTLSFVCFDAPFQLEFPTGDFFRLAFVRGGLDLRFGRVEKTVTDAESGVLPPDTLVAASYAPGFEHFGIQLKTDAVLGKLAALIGATPSRKLIFDQSATVNSAILGLRRLLSFFAAELDAVGAHAPRAPIVELEQALIVSFICSNPHNYTALLGARIHAAASWQVRRAEEYIAAHWNQPITIEHLARLTSTSARSLFREFKRSRGQSPMAFVKDLRLQKAQDMLERLDPPPSITQVAVTCGFGNLGHFARDYFKRFGERPSDTARRNRNLKIPRGDAVAELEADQSKLRE